MSTDTPTPRETKPARIKRLQIGLNTLVQLLILVFLLMMANYLSFNHFKRWDYSRTHKYELSQKTLQVLAGLKKPVKVVVCFSSASDIYQDVKNLLKEYQYRSNNKIEVEIVDSNRSFARATELQAKYKFNAQQENIVILDYDGRTKYIQANEMAIYDTSGEMYGLPPQFRAFKGEQTVTGALLELSDEKANKICVLTGHNERDFNGETFNGIKIYIERENIHLTPLNLQNTDTISADTKAVLIVGPRYDFSERDIKTLRDYWEKKGRIMVLLDPNASTPRLSAFLAEQGVMPQNDRVIRIRQTSLAYAEVYPDVYGSFLEGNPATKNLSGASAFFIGATQSLGIDPAKAQAAGIRLQMLVKANTGYWGESDYNLKDGDPVPDFDANKDHGQPLALVVSIEKGAPNNPIVQVDSPRMIVAGNCDFISNSALSQGNANLDFTISSIDWLLDREELIGIAPKVHKSLTLNLSDDQMGHILMLTVVLIPGVVALFGFGLWWKRRY